MTISTWPNTGYVTTTNHDPGRPVGGNGVMLDGHVRWTRWEGNNWLYHGEGAHLPRESCFIYASHPNDGQAQIKSGGGNSPLRTGLNSSMESRERFVNDF